MVTTANYKTINKKRRCGVLLHPTSLPGVGHGDLGHQAYRFIEFLNQHGFRVWQMLPLGPTHDDGSPYQCLSSHAGNPMLISLDWLIDKGWLDTAEITLPIEDEGYRPACLQQATETFYQLDNKHWNKKLAEFTKNNAYWLDDYALFMALKINFQNKAWFEWPKPIRHRDAVALEKSRVGLKVYIKQTIFEQFLFFTQWQEIRAYAKQHDVELFGDMPIFVARDSADVWAQRDNFLMDSDGAMDFIAGVPPDAFSDTGQRWGNPLYDWQHMQYTGFSWWKDRFRTQLKLFDMVRIDHFRGLQACWQIPEQDETAMNGEWIEVPGDEMLKALFDAYQSLPLVAEDLGVITDEVIALKNAFNLSGMKVLQFAFDGNTKNPHLPHRHQRQDLVYTGTHDNDTSLGWVSDKTVYNQDYFENYIGKTNQSDEENVLSLIRMAMSSVSFLCVLPMQDLLMLDASARMNTPGTVGDNWQWQFDWDQLRPDVIEQVSQYINVYQR